MHRRDNLAHFILASVVVLGLTPLMLCVEAQARIAFSSDRDGNMEIYVMDTDGGNQRNLTNHPDSDFHPSWSPDGKWIAFLSRRDQVRFQHGIAAEIYVMDNDGGNLQRLTNNPHADYHPSWSPDGKQIAFVSARDGNYGIYVIDADGKNEQRLTNNPLYESSPSWSPDGERIVFTARREGHFKKDFDLTTEIYVMDADGGNEQRLTENRKNDWFPFWSPDGERIAFMSERDENYEIYVMDADGGDQKNLTNNPHRDVGPAWFNSPFSVSPAGKKFTIWGWLKQVDR